MSFFRQLGQKAKTFGRQLGGDVSKFGRQLSTASNKVGAGLGKAESFVSTLEKRTSDIPVVGQATHIAGGVLHGLHNVASMGSLGGTALQQAGKGNFKGALNSAEQIGKLGKSTLAGAVKTGAEVAPFL